MAEEPEAGDKGPKGTGKRLRRRDRKIHVNYSEPSRHLTVLTERGLVKAEGEDNRLVFIAMDEGREYLAIYRKMKRILER